MRVSMNVMLLPLAAGLMLLGTTTRAAPNDWPQGVKSPAPAPDPQRPASFIYAVLPDGRLGWYRHDASTFGANDWQAPRLVDQGWAGFKQAFGGENGAIYAITQGGVLRFYRHSSFATGLNTDNTGGWLPPQDLASGWGGFRQVFSGGEGVIYAIGADGVLKWYRHAGTAALQGPKDVGRGWGAFKQVFSPGEGIIYAITQDGHLEWRKHNGYLTGVGPDTAGAWEAARTVGNGWGDAKQVLTAGTRTPGNPALDGAVIYVVTSDGKLMWYKHRGFRDGSQLWLPATDVGRGWGGFQQVFALLSYTATPSTAKASDVLTGGAVLDTQKRGRSILEGGAVLDTDKFRLAFIRDVQVTPGLRAVKVVFSSTQKTPALVEIGPVAPFTGREGFLAFPADSGAFSRFVRGDNGRFTLDLNVAADQLKLNTTYYYVINVFSDRNDPKHRREQQTGRFTTQDQTVSVVWESIHITNDSDPNGSGELAFYAWINHGVLSEKVEKTGRLDLPDGRTHPLQWRMVIPNAPDTLSLALCGDDWDGIGAAFVGVPLYYNSPTDNGDFETNVARGKFDLTQYPGSSVKVPFSLRSMPNGGDVGDLEFEAKGYFVITRGG